MLIVRWLWLILECSRPSQNFFLWQPYKLLLYEMDMGRKGPLSFLFSPLLSSRTVMICCIICANIWSYMLKRRDIAAQKRYRWTGFDFTTASSNSASCTSVSRRSPIILTREREIMSAPLEKRWQQFLCFELFQVRSFITDNASFHLVSLSSLKTDNFWNFVTMGQQYGYS